MHFIKNKFHIYLNAFRDHFQVQVFYLSNMRFKVYITRTDKDDGWGQDLKLIVFSEDGSDHELIEIGMSATNRAVFYRGTKKIVLFPLYIFKSPRELEMSRGKIPKVIHRTLLYDDDFPADVIPVIERFIMMHSDFEHVLWRNQDVIDLIIHREEKYKKYHALANIQKSDFARYLILYYYGGVYADFDIFIYKPLHIFIDLYPSSDCILFVEHVHKESETYLDQPIRKGIPEDPIRVANYLMMSQPFSGYVKRVIDLLLQRAILGVRSDYDIIYTTGPDLTSTVYAQERTAQLVNKPTADSFFSHLCSGHWRMNR